MSRAPTVPGAAPAWPIRREYRSPCLDIQGRRFAWGLRTYLMGVINVTPDSFSHDGIAGDPARAAELAASFEAGGADLIDIGAESSRPGAEPVTEEEELERLLPALEAVRHATSLPISVDTWRAGVARAALAAGAGIVNDIHGFRRDPEIASAAARSGAPAVVMHNQRDRPFRDVVLDIRAGFDASIAIAEAAGFGAGALVLDPGFGFGWTADQNVEMLRRLPELWEYRLPILVGVSRKSTIGTLLGLPVDQRLEGTASAVALAIAAGADMVRVHDVREMARVARVADAVVRGGVDAG